ncbi:hypothetical protein PG997_003381 [Apiospora hydei]|uniref:M6 metalloprotease n=1 Tax=Apiospora hydei TaxID=1337664 RepID=A0ABR1WZ48_9PEZI
MISKLTAAIAALSLWPGVSASPSIPLLKNLAANPQDACKLASGPDGRNIAGFDLGNNVKSTGTIKGWMMFIDFPDAEANGSDPQALFDSHAAAANKFYQTSSYGKLSLEIGADTQQVYRMPATAASYQWGAGGPKPYYLEMYIQDALDAYMHAHNADGDASVFPEMDVLYLIAPPSADFYNSNTFMYDAELRDPNASGNGTVNGTVNGNVNGTVGTAVAHRAIAFGQDLYHSDGYKVLVHETGHTLGLPDYYLTDGSDLPGSLVGGFSLMAVTFEQAPDFFAWDKWRMGWMADSAVHCITDRGSTTHVLSPLENKVSGLDSTQAVVVATSGTTLLVAEARTQNGVDDMLCGPGVLLYTVDTNVPSGQGPVRIVNGLDTDLRWCGGYPPTSRRCLSQSPGSPP